MERPSGVLHKEKESVDCKSKYIDKYRPPMWLPNQIIRHKKTGDPLLVIHVYRNCTIVVSLEEKEPLVTPKALLEKQYSYYARDCDMDNDDRGNYQKKWRYKPVKI